MYDVLEALHHGGCSRPLLATIIQVEGSAYRKEGAIMLFTQNRRYGVLSGGCLEADLAERAPIVWEEGVPRIFVYDMSAEDDLSWGQGHGCNGVVHVLLEPVTGELKAHLLLAKRLLDEGQSLLHIKNLSDRQPATEYLFYAGLNNRTFGRWTGAFPDDLDRLPESRKAGMIEGERPTERLFVQVFEPKPRLVIFGAGPDVKPLARFAASVGFGVVVADWREALCNRANFPDAEELIVGSPDSIAAVFPFSNRDSVVVMTHHFQKDRQLLPILMSKRLRYLGILGSRLRTKKLLGDAAPGGLHFPAGLPIGAEGPEEIAISILSEVIKAVRRKEDRDDCGHLYGGRPKPEDGLSETVFADQR